MCFPKKQVSEPVTHIIGPWSCRVPKQAMATRVFMLPCAVLQVCDEEDSGSDTTVYIPIHQGSLSSEMPLSQDRDSLLQVLLFLEAACGPTNSVCASDIVPAANKLMLGGDRQDGSRTNDRAVFGKDKR